MSASRVRAGLVIALVVLASAIAGAAIERVAFSPPAHRGRGEMGGPGGGPGGPGGRDRNAPGHEARRRTQMLERMSKELSLTPVQRTAVDSVMQRTDSTLREIRREMEPRIESVFAQSRAGIEARLDSAQRMEFAKMARHRPRP